MQTTHDVTFRITHALLLLAACRIPTDEPPSQMGDGCESGGVCAPRALFFTGAPLSDSTLRTAPPSVLAFGGAQQISVWRDLEATLPFDTAAEESMTAPSCTQHGVVSAFCAHGGLKNLFTLTSTPPTILVESGAFGAEETAAEDNLIITSPYQGVNGGRGATYGELSIRLARLTAARMVPPGSDFAAIHGDSTRNPWVAFAKQSRPERIAIGLYGTLPNGELQRIVDQSLSYEVDGVLSTPVPWDLPAAPSSAFEEKGALEEVRILRASRRIATVPIVVTDRVSDIRMAAASEQLMMDPHTLFRNLALTRCFSAYDFIQLPGDTRSREYLLYGVEFDFDPGPELLVSRSVSPSREARRSCVEITALAPGPALLGVVGRIANRTFRIGIPFTSD